MFALCAGLAEDIADESLELRERADRMLAVVYHNVEKCFFVPGTRGKLARVVGEQVKGVENSHVSDIFGPSSVVFPLDEAACLLNIYPNFVNDG